MDYIYLAYGLIILGIILKSTGLMILTRNTQKPIAERKKSYLKFNWPGNIILAIGVIIIALDRYYF